MINKVGKLEYEVTCDNCGDGYLSPICYNNTLAAMAREGWAIYIENGTQYHLCPECAEVD